MISQGLLALAYRWQKPATTRTLNSFEVTEAKKVFADLINYNRVKVIAGRFFFGQNSQVIMAPDGNIYWPGECGNLCQHSHNAATFIHEMMHVYQYQQGINVIQQGLLLHACRLISFNRYNPYRLRWNKERHWQTYNIEQQAEIARLIYLKRLPNVILASPF